MAADKKTLFISYCWADGSEYAEELQAQLADYFEIKRDKTQLGASDNIFEFMADIANQDYVLLVVTPEYVRSTNCMLEVWYLMQQPDWIHKVTVLVIDTTIYKVERKLEILTYWKLKLQFCRTQAENETTGAAILEAEREKFEHINERLEEFLYGISKINNPSQIAVVNELVRKLKNAESADRKNELILSNEEKVEALIRRNGEATLNQIAAELDFSKPYALRLLRSMQKKDILAIVLKADKESGHHMPQAHYLINDPDRPR